MSSTTYRYAVRALIAGAAAALIVSTAAVPASAHRTKPAAPARPAAARIVTPTAAGAGDEVPGQIRWAELAAKVGAARHPAPYTVRGGDTLSSIAGQLYGQQSAWPVLYWANHRTIRWANLIQAGQVLRVPVQPATIPAAPRQLAPAPPPPPARPAAVTAAYTPTQAQAPARAGTAVRYSGGTPGGSFGACVVARESGGNSQVMNSSGHYGLYQFSASTWAAYGGSSADFGHASVGEQNQVFATAIARGGQSNWSLYDGC